MKQTSVIGAAVASIASALRLCKSAVARLPPLSSNATPLRDFVRKTLKRLCSQEKKLMQRMVSALGLCIVLVLGAGAENIDEALAMARRANTTIAAATLSAEAAHSARVASERSRLPSLDVNGSWARLEHSPTLDMMTPAGRLQSPSIFKDNTIKIAGANITLPLYTGGKLAGSITASKAESELADANAVRTDADIRLAVVGAYLEVLRARAAVAVGRTRVDALQSHATTVQRLYEHEGVPKTDLLAVAVVLENARADALQASGSAQGAEEAYNELVGEPLERAALLDEPTPLVNHDRGDLALLTAEALEHRPELQALAAEREALLAAARATHADALPQIGLRAGWQHLETQILDRNDVASIGLGFEWKVFDGGQTAARVSSLQLKSRAVARLLDEAKVGIRREVNAALRAIAESQSRLEAGTHAVAASAENLKLTLRLYQTGLVTNTAVLEATSASAEAQLRRDTAFYDTARANYQLRHALGRL